MRLLQLPRFSGIVAGVLASGLAVIVVAQPQPRRFGGAYSELDERRQQLVTDWVARFGNVTGQVVSAPAFYDDLLSLSTKTTFEAVTHALMTTPLTDASGQAFGDGLALIDRIDSVKGEAAGTAGDRQFRMYARRRTATGRSCRGRRSLSPIAHRSRRGHRNPRSCASLPISRLWRRQAASRKPG